jgi:hypothetical protein
VCNFWIRSGVRRPYPGQWVQVPEFGGGAALERVFPGEGVGGGGSKRNESSEIDDFNCGYANRQATRENSSTTMSLQQFL